jgi:hypothetical protein
MLDILAASFLQYHLEGFFALGFVCFETMFTPSTIALFFSRSTRNTLPSAPLWSPAITLTMSPVLFLALS